MSDFRQRLEKFLVEVNQPLEIQQLTPDASTREYFRVNWNGSTAIACVYPESFATEEQTYLDVTNLFLVSGLPVAKILDFDEKLGVIVQEDFGDAILRPMLDQSDTANREKLLNEAISLIAQIQFTTGKAGELNSIASRLKFDAEKLGWELDFFKTHYFETFKKEKVSDDDNNALNTEFAEIVKELENYAEVLCHRDFHAFNLMIDLAGKMRIIDHQDARIGAASYDLVSLLLDRVLEVPDSRWIREKQVYFLDRREKLGLPKINFDSFAAEFRLQTIQRCLKAIGTFSFQSVNRGKTYFVQYIEPMFRIVLEAAENLQRFPHLQETIRRQLNS